MLDNFIENLFGINLMAFIFIAAFWALVFVIICGDDKKAGFATCVMAVITAWLSGKLGPLLFSLLIIFIIGFVILLIFKATVRKPKSAVSLSPSFPSSASISAGYPPFMESFNRAPAYLYHGAPSIRAASDIFIHNRWRIKNHYPNGIYMSEDFGTAAGYSGGKGAIIEIFVTIPSSMIVEQTSMIGDGDKVLDMGYRLIRNGNVYIAPVPSRNHNNGYYRIEGLSPFRVLDQNKNPISIN
jgi:hypothetical protein